MAPKAEDCDSYNSIPMIVMNQKESIKRRDSCIDDDDCEIDIPRLTLVDSSSSDTDDIINNFSPSHKMTQAYHDNHKIYCKKDEDSKISFSTLEIREYNITLGDNPGGSEGPPISLDWEYNKGRTQVLTLEDYERKRAPRRSIEQLHLPAKKRSWRLLQENTVSFREMEKAAKAAEFIRKQRRKSMPTRSQPIIALKKAFGRLVGKEGRIT